jgi:predicted DNA-binding protein
MGPVAPVLPAAPCGPAVLLPQAAMRSSRAAAARRADATDKLDLQEGLRRGDEWISWRRCPIRERMRKRVSVIVNFTMASEPVSVMLPAELRARLGKQARKRSLKLSTAMRTLLEERLRELEDEDQLSRAEEWQRKQIWAAWEQWEREPGNKNREVPWQDLTALFDVALGRAQKAVPPKSASRSAPASRKTSKPRSAG